MEPGWTLHLDGRDDSENDRLGELCFGAQWARIKAEGKLRAQEPRTGGRVVVTHVDRNAGVLTVDLETEDE